MMNKITTLYREDNFKDTLLGKIPKDWNVVKIGEVCNVVGGSTPSTTVKEYWNGDIPFVTPTDVTELEEKNIIFLTKTKSNITEQGLQNSSTHLLPSGSVLLTSRATIGYCVINEIPVTTNQGFTSLICKDSHNLFILYLMRFLRKRLEQLAVGSTFKEIHRSTVRNITIALPALYEQKRISSILSKMDFAIQETNEVILKTELLKKGLMQELFTKGIGHNEFKETDIGKIPKEWGVVRLGDNQISEIRGNKIVKNIDEIAFIPMELVPDTRIYAKYEIRSLKDVKSSTYSEAGDLLLAKITPSLENGKQGIVPDDVPNNFALATTEVYPIKCKGINTLFLFYLLKFSKFRKTLEFSMRGTTGRLRVPKEAVEKLRIPLPSSLEQQKIAKTLFTVDKKLELERNEKVQLERIKQGLMDLLLIGKIRIKVN